MGAGLTVIWSKMRCVFARRGLCEGKGITMEEEIGKTAGTIWDALNTRGEQSRAEERGKREGTHLRLGDRVVGARRPNCDHAREALVPHPAKAGTGKRSKRLVG